MTVGELVDKLNAMGADPGHEVRVSAFGGLRSGKPVKDMSAGFDWDMGAVVLHPAVALGIYTPADESRKLRNALALIALGSIPDPAAYASRVLGLEPDPR